MDVYGDHYDQSLYTLVPKSSQNLAKDNPAVSSNNISRPRGPERQTSNTTQAFRANETNENLWVNPTP